MSAQPSPKATHYRASLGAALVRGAWTDANPGTEPNGSLLSWPELIRKWAKHTGGNPNVVNAIRNVSLLELSPAHHVAVPSPAHLASSASSGDGLETVASGSASSYIHVAHPTHAPGRSSFEAAQPPITSHASAAAAAPASAGQRRAAAYDGEDGTSAGAWAVDASWGRALESSKGDELRESLRVLQSATLSRDEAISSALAIAYQHHALGEFDLALAAYEAFDWSSDPTIGVVPGDAAITERIRARTLQGMAYELGSRPDSASALTAYLEAAALIDKLSASPLAYPSYLVAPNTTRSSPAPFESQREVLRHVSTALARATVISGRGTDWASTLRILRTYNALAASWPPSFRVNQRHRMLSLYLSALQSSYPATGTPPVDRYLLNGGAPSRQPRATWRAEVAEALAAGQKSLAESTSFPLAGQVNYPVVAFVNQAAAFATISPPLTREVINTLWWATTVTFHSQAVLRHLTRLQVAAGDIADARRTFELYVSLVLKARQAKYPESALELSLNPDDAAAEEISKNGLERDSDAEPAEPAEPEDPHHGDFDSDSDFVSALLVGSRLLLVDLDKASEAWRYISLAGDVVRLSEVPPHLTAKVEEAKGIIRITMATNVATRQERPLFQVQALSHLRAAVALDPSSASAYFHLAYGHAIAREIAPATEAIRTSLELDPHNVRSWHLLTLLLTAANNWKGAEKAGETGVALWESDDTTDELESDPEANSARPLLLSSGENSAVPPTRAARVDKAQRLEAVIQLRMTLNVIAEKLYGPDVALERQTQLFSFFSQRSEAERSGNTTRKRSDTFSTRVTGRLASGRASDSSVVGNDLGGSYVFTPIADVHVSPPSPAPTSTQDASTVSGAASTAGTITGPPTSTTSSGGAPRKQSDYSDLSVDDGNRRLGPRRAMLSHRRSLLNKHLHVPSVVRSGSGRSDDRSETLRAASTPSLALQPTPRARTPSASTVAMSIAPTAVHSHFRGARPIAPPPPPPAKNVTPRSPTEARILSDLWLMSAATFRRAGKPEQALVAIEEAETISPENPNVWVQLGMFHQACGHVDQDGKPSQALAAFTKSLLLRPDHPPAVVLLARLYLGQGDVDLAHSLLSQLTQDRGWDVAEAWYTLGTVCDKQGRPSASRESLLYALELERSRTCRALPDALHPWIE